MDKIKTQDVWVRLGSKTTKLDKPVLWIDGEAIEKHSNMVVLTLQQLQAIREKDIEDAWDAGERYIIEDEKAYVSNNPKSTVPDKTEYLTQLFGGGNKNRDFIDIPTAKNSALNKGK
jgi:hypothetical protein